MALTEMVVVVFAICVPLIAFAALYSYKMREVYGVSAENLGGGKRLLAMRLQKAGAAPVGSAGQLDLGSVATGQWAGKGQASGSGAGIPSTSASGAAGQATTFALESGATLAGPAPLVASLDGSTAQAASCDGAKGPCKCPGAGGAGAGAGGAGLLAGAGRGLVGGGGGAGGAGAGAAGGSAAGGAASGCSCESGAAPSAGASGPSDPFPSLRLSLAAPAPDGTDVYSRILLGHYKPPLKMTVPPPGDLVLGTGKTGTRSVSVYGSVYSDFTTYLDVVPGQRPAAATAYWKGRGYDIAKQEAKLRARLKGWSPSLSLADTSRGAHVPSLVANFDVATHDYPGGTLLRITDADGNPLGADYGNPAGIFRVGDTGNRTGLAGKLDFYTGGSGPINDYYEGLHKKGSKLRVEVVETNYPSGLGASQKPRQGKKSKK